MIIGSIVIRKNLDVIYIYISALNSLVCFGIMLFDMRYIYGFMFLKWFLAMFFFWRKGF